MKYFVFTYFSLFFLFPVKAQQETEYSAVIIDSQTKKPVEDCFIQLINERKAYITDKNGFFSFNISVTDSAEKLILRHIAYQNIIVPLNNLKPNFQNQIFLNPQDVKVEKITINPRLPEDLILKAREQIPFNYPDIPLMHEAYFREKVFEDSSVIQDYEAIIEIYKTPYNKIYSDRMRFLEANLLTHDESSELWEYLYFINGTYETLLADIAKHPNNFIQLATLETNFFKKRHFKFYTYTLTVKPKEFIIRFKPNPEKNRGIFEGQIILNRQSLAIKSVEYAYAQSKMDYIRSIKSNTELSLMNVNVFTPEISVKSRILYKPYKGKMILDRVFNEYSFEFQVGYDESNKKIIKVQNQLTVTKTKSEDVKKISLFKTIPYDKENIQILPDSDKEFWQNYHNTKRDSL